MAHQRRHLNRGRKPELEGPDGMAVPTSVGHGYWKNIGDGLDIPFVAVGFDVVGEPSFELAVSTEIARLLIAIFADEIVASEECPEYVQRDGE